MIAVHLPRDLAAEFSSRDTLTVDGVGDLAELWVVLDHRHPGLGRWLREPDGAQRQHLSLFLRAGRTSLSRSRPTRRCGFCGPCLGNSERDRRAR